MPFCPPQHVRADVGATLLPVLTALESAQTVRWAMDGLDSRDRRAVSVVRHEVAMLWHWIRVSRDECADYSALLDGLADFAGSTDRALDAL